MCKIVQWITQVLVILHHGLFWVDMPSLRQMLSTALVIIMDYQWIYNILIIGVIFLRYFVVIFLAKKNKELLTAAVMDVKRHSATKEEMKKIEFHWSEKLKFPSIYRKTLSQDTIKHKKALLGMPWVLFLLAPFHR